MKTVLAGILLFGMVAIAGAEEGKVYGDADLGSYKQGGDFKIDERAANSNIKSYSTPRPESSSKPSAQEWCDKGQAASDRVKVAAMNVVRASHTESSKTVLYSRGAVVVSTSSDAAIAENEARRELDEANRAKFKLDDDAHRQGIPAGWLNCNY